MVPTFVITSVQTDQSVTIQTSNFPANETFNVLMNTIGTKGIGGTQAGTVSSGSGGSFSATINIPAGLKGQKQIAIRLESTTSGSFSYNWFWNNTSSGGIPSTGSTPTPGPTLAPSKIPTFSITSVATDSTVTIQTSNFPANDTFDVLMNKMGTRGVDGTKVDTISTGSGGSFSKTFNIPADMKGMSQIAIRLESPTSGFFSYNWFWNNTSGGIPSTGATPTPKPTTAPGNIPTFSITSVTADNSVTIKTANFPANDTFDVLMNTMGTRGEDGAKVDTIQSGSGGALTLTFKIPSSLQGERQIAIRLESPTSGFFSYNWFWNNTSSGGIPSTGSTPTPGPTQAASHSPTISISSVVKDSTVTIKTSDFPANDTFTVLMGDFGTRGVGGTNVGTFNSGTGGTQTATFNIPSGLQGDAQIAIRLESPTSGFFAYNWFWNNTAP